MKLTQLTSPWDHGVSVTYQAFEVDDLDYADSCKYSMSINGVMVCKGWARFYRKEKLGFYIYLN